MSDYKEMYLTMLRVSEEALRIIIEAQNNRGSEKVRGNVYFE